MPTKEERKAEAKKHLGMVKGLFASETAASIEATRIYEDGEGRELPVPEPRFEDMEVVVAWTDSASAIAAASGKVCVLDPASFRTPGGNYLGGGWSPEEQICAESNLYPILEGMREAYYDANKQSGRGGLATDRAMYVPDVVFTTNGTMQKRDIVVVAPPNRRFALENHRSEAECDIDLANRVRTILHIAAAAEPDTLVLNAFGCGFFDNEPSRVAGLFQTWLEAHPGQFKRVVFAIAGGPALDAFREVFPEEQRRAPERVVEVVRDDEEDEEEIDIQPNADGRWVFE